MRSRWFILWTVSLVVAVCAAPASSGDRIEQFRQTRKEVLPLLKSKETADRIEALKRLQKFPLEDAVRLIAGALEDPSPEVSKFARESLAEMNGNLEVCETLLAMTKREARSKDGSTASAAVLSILLSSKLQSTRRAVDDLLAGSAGTADGAAVAIAVLDEIATRRSNDDVPALARLTETSVFENHAGVRRTLVYALTQIPSKEAVDVLIGNLDRVGGEARADAVEYLTQLTEQIFGLESGAWQRWWRTAKATYKYPAVTKRAPYRGTLTEGSSGYYYGMPIFAERLVFVLDTSGSMEGPRIEAAKRELTKAITALPDYVQFTVVAFNSRIDVWQRQLVPANEQNKRAAIASVNRQGASASTASYDALETAMAFDTEAIYFLSDGAPTIGKIVAPADIVTAITTANRLRRVSVYTIGIGAGFPGSPLDVFLKTLAEQNLGVYRRVDN
ncbi:MAG: VWA domain-containing protein [Pirellulales bacterium]